jgi:competence protein ComEA
MIFRQFREYFIFTRRERNGLLILVFLLLATVCLDYLIPYVIPEKECDVSGLKAEAEKYYTKTKQDNEKNQVPVERVFDPNNISQEALIKLGIPMGLAGNWVKYLEKGGRFHRKEDVRKLYGMTDELFDKFSVHMAFPVNAVSAKSRTAILPGNPQTMTFKSRQDAVVIPAAPMKKEALMIELNKADSVQLESLPGIGPVLASRIIRYRKLIGGFYSKSQLRDIYGMTEELWLKSAPCLTVDTSAVKKLEVNFLSLTELGRHPYIGFRTARKIVNRRDASGKFTRKDEFEALFSADSLRRILPYIATEDTKF